MNTTRASALRRALRVPAAFALAIGVNAGLWWCLAALRPDPLEVREETAAIQAILLTVRSEVDAPHSTEAAAEPEPESEPEPIEIDLDLPLPAFEPLEPLSVALDLPNPLLPSAAVHVAPIPRTSTAQSRAPAVAASGLGETLDAGQVDRPPRPLAGNADPVYPSRERRRGTEGSVSVRLLIDERGRVAEIEVTAGRGAFVKAVRKAVAGWRFTPPEHRGRPVQVWGVKTFKFELDR
ncbi:MAG: TonB family protein [Planctomycetota bacterium]